MREEILNILLLREINAIRRGRDLKTKEVMKGAEIGHQELVTETLLHKVNELRIITSNDHVINIEKKECTPTGRSVNKESWVMITGFKASINDHRGEVLEPSTRSLLEAIKRATQPANHTIRDGVP